MEGEVSAGSTSAMHSPYRRCYPVATGVMIASVLFADNSADVHAFTHQATAGSGIRGTTQVTFTAESKSSRTTSPVYCTATAAAASSHLLTRNSRRMRTVFRMASDGVSAPSETESRRETERLEQLGREARKSEKRLQVSQELRELAESTRLQVEDALLGENATKDQQLAEDAYAKEVLGNKREKLAEKLRKQDILIEKLRKVHRRDIHELRALVRQEIGEIDPGLLMRIWDLEGKKGEQEERGNSVALIEDVMRAIEMVDKAKALAVSKKNRLYWNEFYESCSYGEAETRFAHWLEEYQQDRAAHQKARSEHPDPAKLDEDFYAAFRNISRNENNLKTDTALEVATSILLSGARATTCAYSLERVGGGKYRRVGSLRYPDYVEGACCTGPIRYSVDVPEGSAHTVGFGPGCYLRPCGGRFQDGDGFGTNLDVLVNIVENYLRLPNGPTPELEAFLDALAASGSVALLTNSRVDGGGGTVVEQLQYLTIYRSSVLLSCVKTHRLGLRLIARTSFLSAEQAAAVGCAHPFMALPRRRPSSSSIYPVEQLQVWRRSETRFIVDDAILQVMYLTLFMYRRYPWPRRQRYGVDATLAKWIEHDLGSLNKTSFRGSFVIQTLNWAFVFPSLFQALLEDHSAWFLLAACDIEERHFLGTSRGCLFWNFHFSSRQREASIIRELQTNRLLTAWVCGKERRYLLQEVCRQRRLRVIQAIATAVPSAFAPAVPGLLSFTHGPSVQGKKERLVEWLESKLESGAQITN